MKFLPKKIKEAAFGVNPLNNVGFLFVIVLVEVILSIFLFSLFF